MNRWIPIAKRILITAAAALVIVYLGDYAWLRYRMRKPTANDPFEVMTIQRTLKISHKGAYSEDGGFDFILEDPQTQTCVHALFPHGGDNPCWYIRQQNGGVDTMVILPIFRSFGDAAKE